jgi:hypothetical protein
VAFLKTCISHQTSLTFEPWGLPEEAPRALLGALGASEELPKRAKKGLPFFSHEKKK